LYCVYFVGAPSGLSLLSAATFPCKEQAENRAAVFWYDIPFELEAYPIGCGARQDSRT
jgi:hypothetical protein